MKKLFLMGLLLCGCTAHRNLETAALVTALDDTILQTALDHRITKSDHDRLYRFYPSTLEKLENYRPLDVQDVINLTRAGVTDDVIIYEIQATRSHFYLQPDDEDELQQAGVSKKVIQAMKDTVDDPTALR